MSGVGVVEDVAAVSTGDKVEVICSCRKESCQQGCLAGIAYWGGGKAAVEVGIVGGLNYKVGVGEALFMNSKGVFDGGARFQHAIQAQTL